MRFHFFIFLIILTLKLSGNNKPDTIFYNNNWEITSKANSEYFRLAEFDKSNMYFTGIVKDYYKNGELQMMGSYSKGMRNGPFIFYSPNRDCTIISYKNSIKDGFCSIYKKDSELSIECLYIDNVEHVNTYRNNYSKDEVLNGSGMVFEKRVNNENNMEYSIMGEVVDSLKRGKWFISNSKGKNVLIEYYEMGKLIKSKPFANDKEIDIPFLTKDFSLIKEPEKLDITESLAIETGVKIRANQILDAINKKTLEERGLVERSNTIYGYEELEPFLDEKILLSSEEIEAYHKHDSTIIVQFQQNTDYSISNFVLLKPTYSENLNQEIINVFKSIDKIVLEKELNKSIKVKYIYGLKLPMQEFMTTMNLKEESTDIYYPSSKRLTKEIYKKNLSGKKNGKYSFIYDGDVQVTGQYLDDLKTGQWIFQPDQDFKMIGYYKSDKNDSIWTCYLKEKIQSIQNFRTGELRSYYPNGNINIKADSINGEYLYIKHSKRGGIIKQIKSGPVYKESKVFDNKGKLLEHIVFKNDIPYNIFISSKEDKDLVLEGDVDKGNGFINVKLRDFLTEELYTKEYFQIKDSKPDGEYKEFNEKGKVLVSGQYKNGFMDGEWFLTNPKKIIHYSSNDSIDYDTVMNIGLQLDYQVYNIEVMPKFNGGEPALEFRKYIARSLITGQCSNVRRYGESYSTI
jgi:antitoxin component YwqK of YwqJK toxin-antitoxin module